MKTEYKLIVDYGKPYEEDLNNKQDLFNRLNNLKGIKDNFSHLEINILNEKGEDITDEIFKEFEFLKNGERY